MGQLMFYLAAVAACLLWSAAFVAAAARTDRTWLRRLLVAVAVVVPLLAVAPWVLLTAALAFRVGLETNWFAPTLTAFVSVLVGGLWVCRAGLTWSPAANRFVAATWPVVGLAAGFVLAKACAFGTLVFIDNAVAAEGRMLRVEAAQMMAAALPPAPAADDDAAPLYVRAIEAIKADKTVGDPKSPEGEAMGGWLTVDVGSPVVAAMLARHATTLDLVRRAADRPGCQFVRDWTRPSIAMPLPEVQNLRQSARLLALAARSESAAGDAAAALADVVRIRRIGMHAASEPTLVCGLVGQAIDTSALQVLAEVLSRLGKPDLPLLDGLSLRDFVATPIVYQRHFLGEEAFGLATLADLADGRLSLDFLLEATQEVPGLLHPGPLLYRCFLLPAEEAGYRSIMHHYQNLYAYAPRGGRFPEIKKQIGAIEDGLEKRREGIFSSLMVPALRSVLARQVSGQALHGAAEVLVAATRARLQTVALPGSAADLVPERLAVLPIDPFTTDATLRSKTTDDAWVVYSIGPDGEDDGGPLPPGAEDVEGNDDVGLRMAR